MKKRIVVGISGASGVLNRLRLLVREPERRPIPRESSPPKTNMKLHTHPPQTTACFRIFRLFRKFPLAITLVSLCSVPVASAGNGDFAEPLVTEPVEHDAWEFSLLLYGWLPWMELETADGIEADIGADDIIKNLDMTVQLEFEARKDRWGFSVDALYLDMSTDLRGRILGDLSLEAWIVTPKVSYRAWEGDRGFVDLQAGLRYYWLGVDVQGRGPLNMSRSADIWDGVIGLRAHYDLNELWYLPLLVDVGAGDSDFLTQAYVGLGYRFKHVDAALGFRLMYYDFGDGAPLKDQLVYGPIISVKFTF